MMKRISLTLLLCVGLCGVSFAATPTSTPTAPNTFTPTPTPTANPQGQPGGFDTAPFNLEKLYQYFVAGRTTEAVAVTGPGYVTHTLPYVYGCAISDLTIDYNDVQYSIVLVGPNVYTTGAASFYNKQSQYNPGTPYIFPAQPASVCGVRLYVKIKSQALIEADEFTGTVLFTNKP